MLEDAKTPESPGWWLLRLGKRLAQDAKRFDLLERYWRGDPPMPYGNKKMREAYKRLQRLARSNFGSLIVEAPLERMKVIGFSSGGDGTDTTDKEAWSWWQANGLDADQGLVHRHALMMSRSYVIVGVQDGKPLVTGEDPRQVIHESSPTNRRDVRAALKTYWDDIDNCQRAVVYLPGGRVVYFVTTDRVTRDTDDEQKWAAKSWQRDVSDDYPEGEGSLPFTEVPVVPFINRPDLAGCGLGEFEDVIDILDRINNQILDRLVISAMQAYRQRWGKGISVDSKDFDPGADLLWLVEDEDAQFGEFQPTDITPIIKAIESDVQELAAITRTPPQYLLAAMINTSGDALGVAESGLVSKVLEREAEFGESWERVYRLAGRVQERDIPTDAEVVWKSPQFRTLTELASAAVQLASAGVPWRTRMRKLDFTPAEIARMATERAEEAMMNAALMQQMPQQVGQPAGNPRLTRATETGNDSATAAES